MKEVLGFFVGILLGFGIFFGYFRKIDISKVLSEETSFTGSGDWGHEEVPAATNEPLFLSEFSPTREVTPTKEISETPKPTIKLKKMSNTPSPKPSNTPPPVPTITATPTPTPTLLLTPTPTFAQQPVFSSEEINIFIDRFSAQYGVDPNVLRHIALCESGFNQSAINGPYAGLYQFSSGTWSSYRIKIGEDTNSDLRLNAEEAVQTAAYVLSQGQGGIWPNCLP